MAQGLFVWALSLALSGCAVLNHGSSVAADAAPTAPGSTASETPREQLNDGYSSLYSQLKGVSKVDEVFYVKIESDDVQHVVEDVTDYSGQLAQRLVKLSGEFPALDIHRVTTPPIIKAVHAAQREGTLKRFAPLVGQSGKAFERGLLIRLLGVVDLQRYLTQVIAERESDPALKEVMQNASSHFARLFKEINHLLNKRFYR